MVVGDVSRSKESLFYHASRNLIRVVVFVLFGRKNEEGIVYVLITCVSLCIPGLYITEPDHTFYDLGQAG
jgi:hypothetical protein